MTQRKEKIAIIGPGTIGTILAANFAKGQREVTLVGKDRVITENAINEAEIIILAISFSAIQEFISQYSTQLKGKIIIDPSNPIAPDGQGGFKKTIGNSESAADIISEKLPEGAKLAKALGTLGAASLKGQAHRRPLSVLFYNTDDRTIDSKVEELIRDCGFESLRVGGLDESIRIEVFGDLHEYGAIGKPVTLSEASLKV